MDKCIGIFFMVPSCPYWLGRSLPSLLLGGQTKHWSWITDVWKHVLHSFFCPNKPQEMQRYTAFHYKSPQNTMDSFLIKQIRPTWNEQCRCGAMKVYPDKCCQSLPGAPTTRDNLSRVLVDEDQGQANCDHNTVTVQAYHQGYFKLSSLLTGLARTQSLVQRNPWVSLHPQLLICH